MSVWRQGPQRGCGRRRAGLCRASSQALGSRAPACLLRMLARQLSAGQGSVPLSSAAGRGLLIPRGAAPHHARRTSPPVPALSAPCGGPPLTLLTCQTARPCDQVVGDLIPSPRPLSPHPPSHRPHTQLTTPLLASAAASSRFPASASPAPTRVQQRSRIQQRRGDGSSCCGCLPVPPVPILAGCSCSPCRARPAPACRLLTLQPC